MIDDERKNVTCKYVQGRQICEITLLYNMFN